MNTQTDTKNLQATLLSLLSRDSDFQIKNLIANHLATSCPGVLVEYGMNAKDQVVREVIATKLNEDPAVLVDMFIWFRIEDDAKVLEHLFLSIKDIFAKEDIIEYEIETFIKNELKELIQQQRHFYYALELLGFIADGEVESLYYGYLTDHRFDDKARKAILQGLIHLTGRIHSINKRLESKLVSIINSPYEMVDLRILSLLVLEDTEENNLADIIETIIETETNSRLRKQAVEMAGRFSSANLSPLLIERLKYDPFSDIRTAAAYALGQLGAFEALPELSNALESDPSFFVREAAAESLGIIKSQEALATLLKGLVDQDSYVRSVSAWSIGQLDVEREENFIMELCNLCRSNEIDIQVKNEILTLLTRLSTNETALDCLMSLFKEEKSDFREIIIETLADFLPIIEKEDSFYKEFLPLIQELMATSRSFSLRANICTFLGNLKEESTFPFLFDRLINDSDPLVRRQASWAITKLNSLSLKEKILNEISGTYPKEIVLHFLEIISAWADETDISIVKRFIKSEDFEVRQHSVELLSAIIDSADDINDDTMEELVILLIDVLNNDPINTVRAAAAHTLGHIVGFDSIIDKNLIEAIKKDKIYSVRELAAEALGYRGGLDVLNELVKLADPKIEKDPSIRYFALISLLNIESKFEIIFD